MSAVDDFVYWYQGLPQWAQIGIPVGGAAVVGFMWWRGRGSAGSSGSTMTGSVAGAPVGGGGSYGGIGSGGGSGGGDGENAGNGGVGNGGGTISPPSSQPGPTLPTPTMINPPFAPTNPIPGVTYMAPYTALPTYQPGQPAPWGAESTLSPEQQTANIMAALAAEEAQRQADITARNAALATASQPGPTIPSGGAITWSSGKSVKGPTAGIEPPQILHSGNASQPGATDYVNPNPTYGG